MPLMVTSALVIADEAIEERFVRASGPGGQNVNKVATAVQLRFDIDRCAALDDGTRARLRALAGNRVNEDGVLVIDARAARTQSQNREDARTRLTDLIRRALIRPKRRRKTRPNRASVERRLEGKRRHSATKRARSKGLDE
jgi:ribosome-associated protein